MAQTPKFALDGAMQNTCHEQAAVPAASAATAALDRLYRKIAWRLLPLLMIAYMVAYLDRVNIGYARLQMVAALGFNEAVYGFGAGIFFIGYLLCEVPSNLLLEKIGVRKTLLRIMLCWGLVAAAMVWVRTPLQFYGMRFALGVFEAGFFPGVVLYLTWWFPRHRRGRVIALFATAAIFASLVAGPLCGAILSYLDGWRGLAGWQWLFVLQGLPAVALGVILYLWLSDKPEQARWLSAEEKALLRDDLQRDAKPEGAGMRLSQLMRTPALYAFGLTNFLMIGASYALVFWMPSMIQGWGIEDPALVGWFSAVPNLAGIFGMVVIGRNSDRKGERRWHYAGSAALSCVGLGMAVAANGNLLGSLIGLSVAMVGVAATTPLFITATTEFLPREVSAAGIGLVTTMGVIGGAASSGAIGLMTQHGAGSQGTLALAASLFLASAVVMLAATRRRS